MGRHKKIPTIRSLWLGEALKDLRAEAGFTAREVGTHLGRDGTSITRIEAGEMPVSDALLDGFLEMYGITDPHKRADLETIRRDTAQTGWWDGYKGDSVVSKLMDRAWMESKAVSIRSFDIMTLPGLLQTPEYAEALMRARNPGLSKDTMARWVDMRMTRQHVLSRHRPLKFMTIIEEQQLRCRAGAKVMRDQLEYLLMAAEWPNTEIRVLPSGVCTGLGGSFELFHLADPYPDVAYAGMAAGEVLLEGDEVESLKSAYDRLLDASLDPEASRELITAERDKL